MPILDKPGLRSAARARRAAAHAEAGAAAAEAIRERFLRCVPRAAGAAIALYAPIRDEADVTPLAAALDAAGHPCALPVVTGPGRPLTFRRWRPGDALATGAFGVREPGPEAAELRPDIVIVPLLAFDRAGHRMGYGAGFYDRTLAALRAGGTVLAVGVGYAAQEVDRVPADEHDQRLDWIVTEREAFRPAEPARGIAT